MCKCTVSLKRGQFKVYNYTQLLCTVVPLYTVPLTNGHPSYAATKLWHGWFSLYINPSPTATPLTWPAATVFGSQLATKPLTNGHIIGGNVRAHAVVTPGTKSLTGAFENFESSEVAPKTKRGGQKVLRAFESSVVAPRTVPNLVLLSRRFHAFPPSITVTIKLIC